MECLSCKKNIRQKFLEKRKNIPETKKISSSSQICAQLEKFLEKNAPINVALFAGTKYEPNLLPMVKKMEKISFYFPKIFGDEMKFFAVKEISDLKPGKFHILEPNTEKEPINPEKIEIFFIPAVSIDEKGNRIGMGGGFYDKYLEKAEKNAKKIGIIFYDQYSKKAFKSEKFDIPMDKIFTEKGVIDIF